MGSEFATSRPGKSARYIAAASLTITASLASQSSLAYEVAGGDDCDGGNGRIAIGSDASACNNFAIALGSSANVPFSDGIAIGRAAETNAASGVAIGSQATAGGNGVFSYLRSDDNGVSESIEDVQNPGMAIGGNANAASGALAFGSNSNASAVNSMAVGSSSVASDFSALAFGPAAYATGLRSTSIGYQSASTGTRSMAFGAASTATGQDAMAYGTSALASGNRALALGSFTSSAQELDNNTRATGNDSLAFGTGAQVTSTDGIAIGRGASVTAPSGTGGVALGALAMTSSRDATALGGGAQAIATNTISIGANSGTPSVASADGAQAIGNIAEASGVASMAYGRQSVASGAGSIAMGQSAQSGADGSIAIGGSTDGFDGTGAAQANGLRSMAVGNQSLASDENALAMGVSATASGSDAIAMGSGAIASGVQSIAIGTGNEVSGSGSGAIGDPSTVTGDGSYSVGNDNTINADQAGAFGNDNVLADTATGSRIIGNGNDIDVADAFVLGNNADVSVANSVALGSNAIADGATLGDAAFQPLDNNGNALDIAGTDPAGEVSIGDTGSERRMTNVAAGSSDTDAVNVSQLAAVDEKADYASQGFNLQANGDTPSNVAPGDTVEFLDGDNISIARNGADITIATTPDLVADSLTLNGGGPALDSDGIEMNGGAISGLAAGAAPDDAVNVSQLESSVAASRSVVTGGTNIADVEQTTGDDGQDVYTVNAEGASVSAGSDAVTVTAAAPDADNVTDYAVDLSQASQNSLALADSSLQSIVTQIDGTEVKTLDQNDNVAGFISGDNIELTDDAGAISIATSDNLTADSLAINDGPTITEAGIDMNGDTLTNVGAPVGSGDAVNLEYFDQNRTHYYSVNDGGTIGGNYDNDGAAGLNSLASGVEASTSAEDSVAIGTGASASSIGGVALGSGSIANRPGTAEQGELDVPGSDALIRYNTTDQTILGGVSVGNAGTGNGDASYRQITNVADGIQNQDAVTIRQLRGAIGSVAQTSTLYFHALSPVDDGSDDSLAVGQNSIAVGPNTVVNADNGIGMGNNAQVEATAPGGTAIGQDTRVTQPDAVALGTSSQATSEQALALGAGATASDPFSVALGSNSVTDAAVATEGVTLGDTDYTFAGSTPDSTVSVGSVGNERTLTNVAAGRIDEESTDAINGSQLFATNQAIEEVNDTATAGWNISAQGDNVSNVAPGETVDLVNSDGNILISKTADSDDVTFDLADDITVANSLSVANGPTISEAGIDMNGDTITNLGTPVNEGDAVNLEYFDQNRTRYYSVNDGGTTGDNYNNDGATGLNAIASGVGASASGENSLALGSGASVVDDDSVALGANSATSEAVGTSSTQIAGQIYAFAGATPDGTVSIGAPGSERTLTNVAAGRISSTSTDAINGSQLYATNQAIETVQGDVNEISGDVDQLGDRVTGVEGDITGLSDDINQLDDRSVQYASNSDGSTDYDSLALQGTEGTTITNLADGDISEGSSDVVNGGQLWELQNELTDIEQGDIRYFQASSDAAEAQALGSESVAIGPQSIARGSQSIAAGDGAVAESEGGVALGSGSRATREGMNGSEEAFSGTAVASSRGALSVGSEGGERQITNVAGGTQPTDAVNVRQLGAVEARAVSYDRNDDGSVDYSSISLGREGTPTRVRNVAAGEADTDAANVGQLRALDNRYQRQLGGLYSKIDDVEDQANAGTASALAAASIPQATLPGKSMIAAGTGNYQGESAVSVGISRLSDNGRWTTKISLTGDTQNNFGGGVGMGFHW